jgi:hypothetical protein
MVKAPRIMPKEPRIMLKAPNKMSFDHLRQLWLSIQFCLKKWEELIYYGKSWNIQQVCFEYLMFMNFVALTFCLKTWTVFLFNEALSFINYRLIWTNWFEDWTNKI